MESLLRLTQKALLSGCFSATDAGPVLRCVDAVVAKGCCGYLAYLEADLLKADMSDKGEDGEKNTILRSEYFAHIHALLCASGEALRALSRLASRKDLSPVAELRLLDACRTYQSSGAMSDALREGLQMLFQGIIHQSAVTVMLQSGL